MNHATIAQMVDKFQCAGCVCGCGTDDCDSYHYDEDSRRCTGHVLGTMLGGPAGLIALGLPKGFRKPTRVYDGQEANGLRNRINIRLWQIGEDPGWDKFNRPIWAMVKDGFLFVRTFAPRIDTSWIDVVEHGMLGMVPGALDVSEFYDEID